MIRSSSLTAFSLLMACLVLSGFATAQTATTTQVVSSGSPTFVGQSVTFTATVTPVQGTVPDGEIVTFYDGTTQIGTGSTAGGVASFSTLTLAAKSHVIAATYSGDSTFSTSSGMVKQVVKAYTSTTTIAADLSPSIYGQPAEFEATVISAGPMPPSGTVTFEDGSKVIGTGKVYSQGLAILRLTALAAGTHVITAKYNGDKNTLKSTSSAVMQVVNSATTGVTITALPNPSKPGQKVTFTATVTSANTPATGTVAFMDGGTALSTVSVASGKASYSTSTMAAGWHVITAVYNDTSQSTQATSSELGQHVQAGGITPAYYATGRLVGNYAVCPGSLLDQWYGSWPSNPNKVFYKTTLIGPPFFGNAYSVEYLDPTQDALYTCHAGIIWSINEVDQGRFTEWQIAYAGDLNPAAAAAVAASSQFSWTDQLYVGGVPDGTMVQLQITFIMNSQINAFPSAITDCAAAFSAYVQFPPSPLPPASVSWLNQCSQPTPSLFSTQSIEVPAGFTQGPINLYENLQVQTEGGKIATEIRVGDAHITIQPLTPGAIVRSMSGVSYAQ